jgi:Flp pilus assembly protein TadB
MAKSTDPFERVVERESDLRRKASVFDSRSGMIRLAGWWFGLLGILWAVLLVVHWVLLADPRWLVVLHTIVFALTVGYFVVAMAFFQALRQRRPDFFDDV